MLDKGFHAASECGEADIELYQPTFFYKENKQFIPEEVRLGRAIARARVHVERPIQRIRLFRILLDKVDWICLESTDKILTIICALVNLFPPIYSMISDFKSRTGFAKSVCCWTFHSALKRISKIISKKKKKKKSQYKCWLWNPNWLDTFRA